MQIATIEHIRNKVPQYLARCMYYLTKENKKLLGVIFHNSTIINIHVVVLVKTHPALGPKGLIVEHVSLCRLRARVKSCVVQ